MLIDRLAGLIRDVSSASGVVLRGPIRGRVIFGRYESQVMSRRVVSVEAFNAHREWEVLVEGSEEQVYASLAVVKRILDIQLQGRFTA